MPARVGAGVPAAPAVGGSCPGRQRQARLTAGMEVSVRRGERPAACRRGSSVGKSAAQGGAPEAPAGRPPETGLAPRVSVLVWLGHFTCRATGALTSEGWAF